MTKMKGWWSGLSRRTLMVGGAVVALLLITVVAVVAIAHDFRPPLTSEVISDAVFRGYNPTDASGSGVFDSFVRIGANAPQVRGYNTDGTLEFETKAGIHTHAIRLSEIPIVDDDLSGSTRLYREFQLDINQISGAPDSWISLDQMEIYLTDDRNLSGYPFGAAATMVWQLDQLDDEWIILDYDNAPGSGKRDLIARIPNELFGNDPFCVYGMGEACNTWVVLYSEFGGAESGAFPNNDGFEEWGVQIYPLHSKYGTKFHDMDADGERDATEPGLAGWTIYVDLNDNGQLDGGEPYDETDANGDFEIVGVVPGTWKVREVDQDGWYCSTPVPCFHEDIFPFSLDSQEIGPNDFGNYQYTPDIDIDKTGDTLSKVGDDVDYTITVDNTSGPGTPDLYCHITDAMLGIDEYVTLARDDPDYVINKSYTVPPGAPDPLVNTASVSCTYVGDTTEQASDSDDHSVNLFQPAVEVIKTGDDLSKVGDDVDYTITINNLSSADSPDLVNGTIMDTLLGDLLDGANPYVTSNTCSATLATGASCVIEATRTVQPGDPDPLPNTVEVHYNPDGFENDIWDEDSHEVNLFQPSGGITKTGDPLSKVGDDVTYSLQVGNTSSADTPAFECNITDALLGLDLDVVLLPGETWQEDYTYTVQPGDPDPLVNTMNVLCGIQGFPNQLGGEVSATTNLFQPAIDVDKTGDDLSKVGDDVNYTITLSNNSSPDTPPLLCDAVDTLTGLVHSGLLPPGDTVYNTTYTVQPGDPDPLVNIVTMVCNVDGFPNVLEASDDHVVELFQPCVDLEKTGDELSKAGDTVTYDIEITNCSSEDAPDLILDSFSDSLVPGAAAPAACEVLGFGGSCSFSYDYTVQQGDPDPLLNEAEVHYHPDGFPNDIWDSDEHSVDLLHPDFTLDKTCMDEPVVAGEDATFEVVFDNTGDVDLVVEFDEDLSGTGCPAAGVPVTVADGESLVCTVAVPADTDPSASTVDNEVNAHVTLPAWTGLDNSWDASASDSCDIYGVKSGYKWWDMNANGEWDGSELGLSGWTIDLLLADGTAVGSTTTGSGGYYEFNMLTPGEDYVVCEVLELGWHQSYPMGTADCTAFGAQYGAWGYAINLMSGEIEDENNFGNYEDIGCTLTQGYWKTHGDPANEKKYDDTWDEVGGPDAPFLDTGQTYIEVMWTNPSGGNAYYILAHQYIAAILNSLKDEDPAATSMIAAELAQAEALLDYYDTYPGGPYIPADGTQFSDNDRALAISIAETLDWFNNGELPGGPPHCE